MPPPPSSTRDFAIAAINLEDTLHSIKLHLENMKASDWAQAYGLSKKLYS